MASESITIWHASDHWLAFFQLLRELTLFTTVSIAVFKPMETSMSKKRKSRSTMEICFKILQLKFDQKLTNRCIGLRYISAPQPFLRFLSASKPLLCHGHYLLIYPMTHWRNSFSRPKTRLHQSLLCLTCCTSIRKWENLVWRGNCYGWNTRHRRQRDGILALLPLLPGMEKNATSLHATGALCWRKALYRLLRPYSTTTRPAG